MSILKIISILLVLLLIGLVPVFLYTNKIAGTNKLLIQIGTLIQTYIREDGKFPDNQKDLEKCEAIRIMVKNGEPRYYTKSSFFDAGDPDNPRGWNQSIMIKRLPLFKIAYGTDLSQLTSAEKGLIDKKTQQTCLLIDGPFGTKFPGFQIKAYKSVSEWWFKEYEKYHNASSLK